MFFTQTTIPISLSVLEFLALMKEFWSTGAFLKTTEIAYHQQHLLRADIVLKISPSQGYSVANVGCTFQTHSRRKSRSNYNDKFQVAKRILPFLFFNTLLIWNYKQISVICRAVLAVYTLKGHLQRSRHYFVFC